jgi:hypothetical protein
VGDALLALTALPNLHPALVLDGVGTVRLVSVRIVPLDERRDPQQHKVRRIHQH